MARILTRARKGRRICALGALVVGPLHHSAHAVLAEQPSAAVTVRASRLSEAESVAPTSSVSVIDAQRYANEVKSVGDALGESVGVSVRRYGGLGAFSTLSIRGTSSNQVQLYLDGVPLSHAQNETVNLGDLPIDSLERIEVYRGTAPVGFGVAGIGGVVNLVTKPPSDAESTTASAAYGSFTTRKAVVTHTQKLSVFDVLAHVSYLGSAGNFRFVTDKDTREGPQPKEDDREITRINNGFDSVDSLLKAGLSVAPGVRLEISHETFWKENGVPGRGADQARFASADDLRTLSYARLRSSDWLLPQLDLDATLFGTHQSSHFKDLTSPPELGTGLQDRSDRTTTFGANVSPTAYIAGMHTVSGFFEGGYEQFRSSNDVPNPPQDPDAQRLRATVAGQDQLSLWSDRILIVPTLRYEHISDENDEARSPGRFIAAQTRDHDLFSPAGGVRLEPWSWLSLRGNIGQYERAPNFSELFGNTGTVVGDPRLKTETALNRDIGFTLTPPPQAWFTGRLEYTYFNNDIDDLIVFVATGSRGIFVPMNVGKARIRGHEVSARTQWLDHLRIEANYTHQEPENRSPINRGIYLGKDLPGRPRDELFLRAAYEQAFGSLYYEFNLIGKNFLKFANFGSDTAPQRDIHSIGASCKVLDPLTLSMEVRNLTDNQISDVGDFPLPGRSLFGSASVSF